MLTDDDKEWIKEVLDGRLDAVEERLKEFAAKADLDMETAIISEFWKSGRTADMRYRQDHDAVATLDQRVQALEDRITALERRDH